MVYTCIDSMEFNMATAICENAGSFECGGTDAPSPDPSLNSTALSTVSPGELLEAMTTSILGDNETAVVGDNETAVPMVMDPTAPTNYPTKLGPPLYYGDFRTSSCLSAAADATALAGGIGVPAWLSEDLMYQSKEECCSDMFGWAPLENCLGPDWKETNYVRGTRSPTMSPSMMPTGMPSNFPR
jgi:hypothetical protein